MRKVLAVLGLALCLAWPAAAQARQVDLSRLDGHMAGPRTRVLVLGSIHLSELPDSFDPRTLAPVIDRLADFRPDIITVEDIRGDGCDHMARYPATYDPDALVRFCGNTDAARAATGLGVPAALAEIDRVLAEWPAQPTPAQRRHLAALFLAGNDKASALTQWLQLPPAQRVPGEGLDSALVSLLDKAMTTRNEGYQIAAVLAARLGLQRVYPIDDHTGDALDVPPAEIGVFSEALGSAWASGAAGWAPFEKRIQALKDRGDMLALYRYYNRPDVLQHKVESDFGSALRDASPQHYGQRYVAGWETRNLRMVANICEAFRGRPGARVLSLVGATHKPWFDSLLGQMQGVDVVPVEAVLGPGTQVHGED